MRVLIEVDDGVLLVDIIAMHNHANVEASMRVSKRKEEGKIPASLRMAAA
jgi:hypothetical protein